MKQKIIRFLQHHAIGQHILDFKPGYATLFDGTSHRLPGKIVSLVELWQNRPTLRRESLESYAAYEGGDFIDVGAFHGWYSWLLAPKANPGNCFLSCEPDPRAFNHLLRNIATFGKIFPKLTSTPIPQPIGSGAAIAVHHPGGGHPQFSSNQAPAEAGAPCTLQLDALAAALKLRPTFIKIDVEGAELGVLQGMAQLLADTHPTLMVEIHPQWQPAGVTVEQVQAELKRHGYRATGEPDVSAVAVRQIWK